MRLITLLPFMESEEIKELAEKIIKKEVKGVSIVVLYPFLEQEDLKEVFDLVLAEGNKKYLYGALPFLNTKSINALHDEVRAGNIKGFKEEALIPFLSKDKIKELFKDLVANAKDEDLDEEISDAVDEAFDEEA